MTKIKNLSKKNKNISFFIPKITRDDQTKMLKVFNLKILTNGSNTKKFENQFAKYTNSKYATAVSNATAALHLSLNALGIGKNDEVIVPNITFLATANSILMTGATPVLVDVNLDDLNININSIKNSLTKKTKAILPVHLAGKSCKMDDIMKGKGAPPVLDKKKIEKMVGPKFIEHLEDGYYKRKLKKGGTVIKRMYGKG